jgi:glutathione S-transferase
MPDAAPPVTGNTALPVLYSFRRCPYAMRARLALAVSEQRCELREIVLRDKPPEMRAASPKATVPVLVLPSGVVLEESLAIIQWALHQHDPEGWLPADSAGQQAQDALIAANDGPFKHALDRYKYPNRYLHEHGDEESLFAQTHRASGAHCLTELQTQLGEKNWLFGPTPSLADMAILPFVRQFAHTDPVWFAAQPWPQLGDWLRRWESSALYPQIMEKYLPWQTGRCGPAFPSATSTHNAEI